MNQPTMMNQLVQHMQTIQKNENNTTSNGKGIGGTGGGKQKSGNGNETINPLTGKPRKRYCWSY